EHEYHVL
ncbi:Protein of unknown function, partial [Gryllus bimaculatus]